MAGAAHPVFRCVGWHDPVAAQASAMGYAHSYPDAQSLFEEHGVPESTDASSTHPTDVHATVPSWHVQVLQDD
jgi:hypothetical protein